MGEGNVSIKYLAQEHNTKISDGARSWTSLGSKSSALPLGYCVFFFEIKFVSVNKRIEAYSSPERLAKL